MRLLLDTHVFLWWLQGDRRLSSTTRKAIAEPSSIVHVSAVSVWEAAIKVALGRLRMDAELPDEISASGFIELPVASTHAWMAGRLPRHHDDPFDRMLVAQAAIEELTIVTNDAALARYDVPLLPA